MRKAIGGNLKNMAWVDDFDGDGDLDIFGTDGTPYGGTLGWAQNDGSGNFTFFNNVTSGQNTFFHLTFLDAGLAAGTTHTYRVIAVDTSDNASSLSVPVSATTFAAPSVPTLDLSVWFKADAGVIMNGSSVSQWTDQSGQSRHATQAVQTSRPVLQTAALNGLPTVTFDGLNDFLAFNRPVNGLSGLSLFLVAANTQSQAGGATSGITLMEKLKTNERKSNEICLTV